jgi:hypothetical protein
MGETDPRNAEPLLRRGEEARSMAARMVSREARLVLLALARCYQRLAQCVARDGPQPTKKPPTGSVDGA